MQISKEDQELHNKMLRSWVNTLKNNGYTDFYVALPEFSAPKKIGKHIPDFTAKAPDGNSIGEVKTCNDIDNDHTKEQLMDYSKTGSKVLLLVPESCLKLAQQKTNEWKLDNVKIWHKPKI